MEKGTFGYVNQRRKSQLIKTILMYALALGIFIAGYYLNLESKKNIWSIVAVLLVLPATKIFISYIVLIPYHSVSKELYDKVKDLLDKPDIFYTDYVITSTEKSMGLSFLVVSGNQIVGLCMRKKDDEKYITEYLEKLCKLQALPYHVFITQEEGKFLKAIKRETLSKETMKENDLNDVKSLLKSLMV